MNTARHLDKRARQKRFTFAPCVCNALSTTLNILKIVYHFDISLCQVCPQTFFYRSVYFLGVFGASSSVYQVVASWSSFEGGGGGWRGRGQKEEHCIQTITRASFLFYKSKMGNYSLFTNSPQRTSSKNPALKQRDTNKYIYLGGEAEARTS